MGSRVRHAAAAGSQYARRLFFCALVCLSGVMLSAEQDVPVAVSVTDGTYHVSATFAVPQLAERARAVLMDFERIPQYLPDIKTSIVRERSERSTLVEQQAVSRFMMFSKEVHLVLQVTETPGTIRFRDICGRSFAVYEGAWILETSPAGTQITYQLAAKPSFDVPGFVLKRLLKRDAGELVDRIKVEIAARADRRE
jgi:ribosome-associated toxin RatA of RatAB toxin-antitoxin module